MRASSGASVGTLHYMFLDPHLVPGSINDNGWNAIAYEGLQQIHKQLGLKSVAAARSEYAAFARAVADKLGYAPPRAGKSPIRWWYALSVGRTGLDDRGDGDFECVMRPELVTALRMMKWA